MGYGIRTINIEKDENGQYASVRLVFGPHYFVELHSQKNGNVTFVLGATHHGFKADASEIGGELEKIINDVSSLHPKNRVD